MCPYDVRLISISELMAFVAQHHYSSVMPRHNKVRYGGFRDGVLVAAISFGDGIKPKQTIPLIFPSLNTGDYLEIGKMCIADSEPRNSETQFMSEVFGMLRKQFPNLKLIFTWADGILGKPGYVYQAGNFLYGGFIWTERYWTKDGKCIHPLRLQAAMRTYQRTQRPNAVELAELEWRYFKGKLFRYIRFLCNAKEQERLLAESPFPWTSTRAKYPKDKDLAWKQRINGKLVPCAQPEFKGMWDSREAGAA